MAKRKPKITAPAPTDTGIHRSDPVDLGDFMPGQVVELLTPTHHGGTMAGGELPQGAVCRIAWHAPSDAPMTTFLRVRTADGRFGDPISVSATAQARSISPLSLAKGQADKGDEVDPMKRHTSTLPLLGGSE